MSHNYGNTNYETDRCSHIDQRNEKRMAIGPVHLMIIKEIKGSEYRKYIEIASTSNSKWFDLKLKFYREWRG